MLLVYTIQIKWWSNIHFRMFGYYGRKLHVCICYSFCGHVVPLVCLYYTMVIRYILETIPIQHVSDYTENIWSMHFLFCWAFICICCVHTNSHIHTHTRSPTPATSTWWNIKWVSFLFVQYKRWKAQLKSTGERWKKSRHICNISK